MTGLDGVVALFVPADRPERFPKALASDADMVIVDLEDAVAPDRREAARASMLSADIDWKRVVVRMNPDGTSDHEADLSTVRRLPVAGVLLAKAEDPLVVGRLGQEFPVLLQIELANGLANVRRLARTMGVVRLAFGSFDYCADIGCAHEQPALLHARSEIVLASRLGGLHPPLDGVTANKDDELAVETDARIAVSMGFGGKLCIHPAQIAPIRRGFVPGPEEKAWAEKVWAVGEGGVASVDGMMVDGALRRRAAAILARS